MTVTADQRAANSTEGDHDEDDLDAFEPHRLEARRDRARRGGRVTRRAESAPDLGPAPPAALGAEQAALMARRLQRVAMAALGWVGLDDVAGDDAYVLGPDAADQIQIEWRLTLPLAG
jgi:hypothetical protein